MLRKAIDFGIRLKLLQSEFTEKDLLDNQGNELDLDKKIKVLRNKGLISPHASKDLDIIKWFGNQGAHSKMSIVLDDVKDNVEPRVRAFFGGLNLKT
ncbi:MAG: DUF4145 domain-containing protein [Nitrososphaerota archaeon]|jgi:hypothetical protein|nr:DUF4145 domain-containing protein [Nitrososphaerota archaeon]